eukprot:164171_1
MGAVPAVAVAGAEAEAAAPERARVQHGVRGEGAKRLQGGLGVTVAPQSNAAGRIAFALAWALELDRQESDRNGKLAGGETWPLEWGAAFRETDFSSWDRRA